MGKFVIPAIRGRLQENPYYVGTMRFRDFVDHVTFGMFKNEKSNAGDVPLHSEQFSQFIIINVSGDCQWEEIEFGDEDKEDFHNVGFLCFGEDSRLTVMCGQDCASAIFEIVKSDPQRGNESCPVIFVSEVGGKQQKDE